MQKFLNTLWEFTGGKEDKDNFIQKALKVCKVFKVKPLKTPKPDVPSKKTAYNLFCREIRKTKKELQGVPVSKASAIISKEWKKVKASEKKMKKYKDLYEEEKQRHEEALQRYQEDHMDEIEIINLHKSVTRRLGRFHSLKKHYPNQMSLKKNQSHSNQMNLKKYQGLLMIQARKNRSLKKSMEKRPLQRQEKKLKRPHSLKKHQSHLNLLTQAWKKKKKDCSRTKKSKVFLIFRRIVEI